MTIRVIFLLAVAACFGDSVSAQPEELPITIPFKLTATYNGSVQFGDLEGDGDLDLAIVGNTLNGPHVSVYQLGDSSFTPAGTEQQAQVSVLRRVSQKAHPVSQGTVRWGDFDGDGDDDLLITGLADYVGGTTRHLKPTLNVYENNGVELQLGGRALLLRKIELPGLYRSTAAWGDYDGDGDLDFVASGLPTLETDEPVTWLYRNDAGTFAQVNAGLPGVYAGDLAAADYDGDGDIDLALMGDSGGGVFITRIYRNDGGSFSDSGTPIPGLAFGSLDWGDYDVDGDPDLLVTGGHLDPRLVRGLTRVYRNQGGVLIEADFDLDDHVLGEARWGDMDRDGDLDIFALGAEEALQPPFLHFYAFDGTGFVPVWEETGLRYSAMAVGDYNGDGDADVVMSGELSVGGLVVRFLMNRDYRECVVPDWLRIGQLPGNC